MDTKQAAKVLREHQAWRKGGDGLQTDVVLLTEAIDVAVASLDSGRYVLVEVGILPTRCLDAAIRDAEITRKIGADNATVIAAAITGFLVAHMNNEGDV